MRRTYNPEWVINGDVFVGIKFGHDTCAEHECGIADLKRRLGIPTRMTHELHGIEARRVSQIEHIRFVNLGESAILYCYTSYSDESKGTVPGHVLNETKLRASFIKGNPGDEIACAWDERSFGVQVAKAHIDKLQALYDAAQKGDFGIWMSGGLYISIISRQPPLVVKALADDDLDKIKLREAAEKTGIEEYLRKHGKHYFALSPRWIENPERKSKTQWNIVYWLNPMEQHIHEAGWFTVEELMEWAENKGPVMKPARNPSRGRR